MRNKANRVCVRMVMIAIILCIFGMSGCSVHRNVRIGELTQARLMTMFSRSLDTTLIGWDHPDIVLASPEDPRDGSQIRLDAGCEDLCFGSSDIIWGIQSEPNDSVAWIDLCGWKSYPVVPLGGRLIFRLSPDYGHYRIRPISMISIDCDSVYSVSEITDPVALEEAGFVSGETDRFYFTVPRNATGRYRGWFLEFGYMKPDSAASKTWLADRGRDSGLLIYQLPEDSVYDSQKLYKWSKSLLNRIR